MLKFKFWSLIKDFSRVVCRFPLSIICAIAASCLTVYLDLYKLEHENTLNGIIFTLSLGLPLFLALQLFSENYARNKVQKIFFILFGVILILLYGISFPYQNRVSDSIYFVRYFSLSICFHTLISLAPFILKSNSNAFWQFNKIIFLRIFSSLLFSSIFYLGLCGAIATIDSLFTIKISFSVYYQIWILVIGIFNTFLILTGIPKKISYLKNNYDYPKSLQILTKYILAPLVIIYFLILIIYETKMLLTWTLPKGDVSTPIVVFFGISLLTKLLLHPQSLNTKNPTVRKFINFIHLSFIPNTIMLWLAIYVRIHNYGITINRYLLIALAIIASLFTFYFNFSRRKKIEFIPFTIVPLSLLILYGPWSAFTLSRMSQFEILKNQFKELNLYQNQHVQPLTNISNISSKQNRTIRNVSKYLINNHGISSMQPFFKQSLKNKLKNKYTSNHQAFELITTKLLKLPNSTHKLLKESKFRTFSANTNHERALEVRGYEYILQKYYYLKHKKNKKEFIKNHPNIFIEWISSQNKLSVVDKTKKQALISIDLNQFLYEKDIKYKMSQHKIPVKEMTIANKNAKIIIKSIYSSKEKKWYNIRTVDFIILFNKNN